MLQFISVKDTGGSTRIQEKVGKTCSTRFLKNGYRHKFPGDITINMKQIRDSVDIEAEVKTLISNLSAAINEVQDYEDHLH